MMNPFDVQICTIKFTLIEDQLNMARYMYIVYCCKYIHIFFKYKKKGFHLPLYIIFRLNPVDLESEVPKTIFQYEIYRNFILHLGSFPLVFRPLRGGEGGGDIHTIISLN